MKLYHGTNITFRNPDLRKCNRYTDFGCGFYLTHELERAKEWGKNRNPIKYRVNVYDIEDDFVQTATKLGLQIKQFLVADTEWAKFVYNNRNNEDFIHHYDIVIGPVADNGLQARFAEMQRYGLSFEQIASNINFTRFKKPQICFCTQRSIRLLKYIRANAYTNRTSHK